MFKPTHLFAAVIFSSLLGAGAIAATDTHAKHERCEGMEHHGGKMGMGGMAMGDPQKHLAELHAKLKLSKDQEPAWQTFSDQVTAQAKKMGEMHEHKGADREKMGKTTPERMDMMAGMMQERAQTMRSMADALKTFYATLTPEQKATLDAMHKEHMGHMKHHDKK